MKVGEIMKAFGINHYGEPSVIESFTKNEPDPKDGQVKIKVTAFAINPYDAALRRGDFQTERSLKFPYLLGSDLTGEIVAIGPNVSQYQVGDQVINHRPKGAYSEFVTASTSKIMPRPQNITIAQAASLPTPGIAAYNAWHTFAEIQPNDVIAIIGMGGAVGSLLAQIAVAAGHSVIGVANSRHAELAAKLHVTQFISYDHLPAEQTWQHSADVVFNTGFAGQDHGLSDQLVKAGGKIVVLNGVPEKVTTPNVTVIPVGYRQDLQDADAFAFWQDFLSQHDLEMVVQAELPFECDKIVFAHELIEAPHWGKIVINTQI